MRLSRCLLALLCICVTPWALAQHVVVDNAWVRATVPGQKATGAFMQLTASEDMYLVSASSAIAGYGEVHEMHMEGDVMRMRALREGVLLPAGQRIELRPGALHLMLMDLHQPVSKGSTVALTLVFRRADGSRQQLDIAAPASLTPPVPAAK